MRDDSLYAAAPSGVAPWRRALSQRVERGLAATAAWLLRHWLGLINWGLGLILFGAVLTPILAYLGVEPLAGMIFRAYHSICDQIPSHALFIFGHQMALCSRNTTLYGSLWLGSMLFRFVRGRIRPLDWRLLILMLLPMALDGTTQLFGWRESDLLLRLITGFLFGFGLAWFALPFVQEAIDEPLPEPPTPQTIDGLRVVPTISE